jgi:hypothetical protein
MSLSNEKPIPPARVAGMAGDTHYVPDWDPGKPTISGEVLQVVPVMVRPVDVGSPAMVEGITIRPARMMDAGEARNTMTRIINDILNWVEGFPYELTGEAAYVLNVFQELKARRLARVVAAQHDQTVEPDRIDGTIHLPPVS